MTTYFEIPLSPVAQRFSVTLAGVSYQVQMAYRGASNGEGGWVLDLFDAGGVPLATGVPLVTGVDLLGPYPDIGVGGGLFVDTVPTYDGLGTLSRLYFGAPT